MKGGENELLNLKIARIKKGLSQSELAELVNVQAFSISRYETGTQWPSIETLLRMSEVLEVSVDHLLGKEK